MADSRGRGEFWLERPPVVWGTSTAGISGARACDAVAVGARFNRVKEVVMAGLRCPGMDPAHFTPDDVKLRQCVKCGEEVEFWKDDIRMTCDACGAINYNPDIANTCLAWCDSAKECVGNNDIVEWKKKTGGGYSSRAACDDEGGVGGEGR